ncbi:tyrosine phosphatase family protein [Antarcticirhabdus aurantiaca]|uniref:Protein tyrosine phosphatase n=1 Tax=Antarcticirhabdus aurantiaca TaxID=2606717 RepID=A0ACD4NHQ7_9HYPH|nr:protein tyrosine phosphatase [Antarcticirhabdus aurantiaca]WAJ26322.1 protein tyrosine phosphatase [Jeongeuplla avenae]
MSAILVSPASQVRAVLDARSPGRFVALRSPGATAFHPETIASADQLHLEMNDIAFDRPGLVSPRVEQVEALLALAQGWDRRAPLLVHCYAGISRSTAAALLIAAMLRPEAEERQLAAELRRLSPAATPNPYLVRLGDALLRRSGRLVAAVEEIGRGAEAFEGTPFAWNVS